MCVCVNVSGPHAVNLCPLAILADSEKIFLVAGLVAGRVGLQPVSFLELWRTGFLDAAFDFICCRRINWLFSFVVVAHVVVVAAAAVFVVSLAVDKSRRDVVINLHWAMPLALTFLRLPRQAAVSAAAVVVSLSHAHMRSPPPVSLTLPLPLPLALSAEKLRRRSEVSNGSQCN